MSSAQFSRFFAHVPVYYWPWLIWQLFCLDRWVKAHGRSVLISVDKRGNLFWNAVSEDPEAPIGWAPSPPRPSPWAPFAHQDARFAKLAAGLCFDPTRTGDPAWLAAWVLSYNGRVRALCLLPDTPEHALPTDARAPP